MPIYEYQCETCDEVIEVRQNISEDKLTNCQQAVNRATRDSNACGKPDAPVKRLMSNTSFVLKGSGWYKTDYASTGGKKEGNGKTETANGGDKSGSATPDKKSSGSGESKSSSKDSSSSSSSGSTD